MRRHRRPPPWKRRSSKEPELRGDGDEEVGAFAVRGPGVEAASSGGDSDDRSQRGDSFTEGMDSSPAQIVPSAAAEVAAAEAEQEAQGGDDGADRGDDTHDGGEADDEPATVTAVGEVMIAAELVDIERDRQLWLEEMRASAAEAEVVAVAGDLVNGKESERRVSKRFLFIFSIAAIVVVVAAAVAVAVAVPMSRRSDATGSQPNVSQIQAKANTSDASTLEARGPALSDLNSTASTADFPAEAEAGQQNLFPSETPTALVPVTSNASAPKTSRPASSDQNVTSSTIMNPFVAFRWSPTGDDLLGEGLFEEFGRNVSLAGDGTTLAVGAHRGDVASDCCDSGRVAVYRKNNNSEWTQLGQNLTGAMPFDLFGKGLASSADGKIFAASGVNYIKAFRFMGSEWIRLGNDLNPTASGEIQGHRLSLSDDGNTLATFTRLETNFSFRVFRYNGTKWDQGQAVTTETKSTNSAEKPYDASVSISGDGTTLAIGVSQFRTSTSTSGCVRVFRGSSWHENLGSVIRGAVDDDEFGASVSMSEDGNIIAVGAPEQAFGYSDTGYVHVYRFNGTDWDKRGPTLRGDSLHDGFGMSVSLTPDGTKMAVGAPRDYRGNHPGYVKVFRFEDGNWWQYGDTINGKEIGDEFGISVSLSDDGLNLAAGAPQFIRRYRRKARRAKTIEKPGYVRVFQAS